MLDYYFNLFRWGLVMKNLYVSLIFYPVVIILFLFNSLHAAELVVSSTSIDKPAVNKSLTTQSFKPLCVIGEEPSLVENVDATDGDYTDRVLVSFDTVSCADSYDIYREEVENNITTVTLRRSYKCTPYGIKVGSTITGSYVDTNATPLQEYSYSIVSKNKYGKSCASDADRGYRDLKSPDPIKVDAELVNLEPEKPIVQDISIACLIASPKKPSDIEASSFQYSDRVVISNYEVACAVSYNIYRAKYNPDEEVDFTQFFLLENTTSIQYTDFINADQTWLYYVKAVNAKGESYASNIVKGSTSTKLEVESEVVLLAPQNLQLGDGGSDITLIWDRVEGAQTYMVYRDITGVSHAEFEAVTEWPGSENTFIIDVNVESGVNYHYYVTAVTDVQESDRSYISRYILPEPSEISATDGLYSDGIGLSIYKHDSSGIEFYESSNGARFDIYRNLEGYTEEEFIGSSNTPLIRDTDIEVDVHYCYRVKVCNGAGCSDFSASECGYASSEVLEDIEVIQADSQQEINEEEMAAEVLIAKRDFEIFGTFGMYDFDGVDNAFDWVFTTIDGLSYQLLGNTPTSDDVFGWKKADIVAPEAAWYMFKVESDIDGDGLSIFDWILVSTDMKNKAAYKLSGVSELGGFEYSDRLDVDYTLEGNKLLFQKL